MFAGGVVVSGPDGILRTPEEMTGYSLGGITVSSNAEASALYYVWKAFDSSGSTAWVGNATTSAWVKIDFGVDLVIRSIEMANVSGRLNRTPRDFVVESSIDDAEWVAIFSGVWTDPVADVLAHFDFPSSDPARFWRITVTTERDYEDAKYTSLSRILMYT